MFDKHFFSKENVWEYLQHCKKPIILYGMGNGADKVLKIFARKNIVCQGIMASDDFVRGQQYKDFTVRSLRYFENLYDDFIIAITFGTQVPQVIRRIKELSQKHRVIVPNVPVYGEEIFDDDFICANREKMELTYALFSDNRSREVYCDALQFYYSGTMDYLFSSFDAKDKQLFSDILSLSPYENYLDLGAYRGDTIEELIHYAGGYRKVIAVEPDPKTYKKLCGYIRDKENIVAYQKLVWKKDKMSLLFSDNGGRNSTLGNQSGIYVDTITIDEIAKNISLSYIKMDVEGAEKEALAGGINTLKFLMPKLNIAVYHRFEDVFTIPLLIHAINPGYDFYLRHHPYIPMWDMNLYCSPSIINGCKEQCQDFWNDNSDLLW